MSEISNLNLKHEDMQYFNLARDEDPTLRELGLTIVHPFYNEEMRFRLQWKQWMNWDRHIREAVKVIIADDHSDPGMETYVPEGPRGLDLQIYRIKENLKWNTPGALNMGIKEATTEWVLIMDSDCLLAPNRLEWLLDYPPEPELRTQVS